MLRCPGWHQVSLSLALGIPSSLLGWSGLSHIGPKATMNELIWNTYGSTSFSGNWLDQQLMVVILKHALSGTKCQRSAVSMGRRGQCVPSFQISNFHWFSPCWCRMVLRHGCLGGPPWCRLLLQSWSFIARRSTFWIDVGTRNKGTHPGGRAAFVKVHLGSFWQAQRFDWIISKLDNLEM